MKQEEIDKFVKILESSAKELAWSINKNTFRKEPTYVIVAGNLFDKNSPTHLYKVAGEITSKIKGLKDVYKDRLFEFLIDFSNALIEVYKKELDDILSEHSKKYFIFVAEDKQLVSFAKAMRSGAVSDLLSVLGLSALKDEYTNTLRKRINFELNPVIINNDVVAIRPNITLK